MDEKIFTKAIKVLVPYFVGLRNEMRGLLETMKRVEAQEPPTRFDVRVENPQEEVGIKNFPEVQRVELENNNVAVDGLLDALAEHAKSADLSAHKRTRELAQSISDAAKDTSANHKRFGELLAKAVKALGGTLDVKVKNQVEFPKVQKVEITNAPKAVTEFKVTNSKPSDAIPVRLVDERGKRFYSALLSAMTDIDLSKTNKLLQEIRDAQGDITINAGDISLNTDGLEYLLGKEGIYISGDEISSVNTDGEITPWDTYTVPTGKTLLIKGVSVSGMGDGLFQLQVNNGVLVWTGRTSWTQRTIPADVSFSVQAGDFVNMHLTSNAQSSSVYHATIWGYLITNPI